MRLRRGFCPMRWRSGYAPQRTSLRVCEHSVARRAPVFAVIVPNVRERFSEMVHGLDHILKRDPEGAREALRSILDDKIRLRPDKSGRFLWAEYSLGMSALLPRQTNADIVVAGAGFEPATFGL